jgi:hypothetical protein
MEFIAHHVLDVKWVWEKSQADPSGPRGYLSDLADRLDFGLQSPDMRYLADQFTNSIYRLISA